MGIGREESSKKYRFIDFSIFIQDTRKAIDFRRHVVLLHGLVFRILLFEEEPRWKPSRGRLCRAQAEFRPRPVAVELQAVPRRARLRGGCGHGVRASASADDLPVFVEERHASDAREWRRPRRGARRSGSLRRLHSYSSGEQQIPLESHRRPGLVFQEGLQLSSKARFQSHDATGEEGYLLICCCSIARNVDQTLLGS